jgi:hypothetical protein
MSNWRSNKRTMNAILNEIEATEKATPKAPIHMAKGGQRNRDAKHRWDKVQKDRKEKRTDYLKGELGELLNGHFKWTNGDSTPAPKREKKQWDRPIPWSRRVGQARKPRTPKGAQ